MISAKDKFHFERETQALHLRGVVEWEVEYHPDIQLLNLVADLVEVVEQSMIGMPITEIGEAQAKQQTALINRAKSMLKKFRNE